MALPTTLSALRRLEGVTMPLNLAPEVHATTCQNNQSFQSCPRHRGDQRVMRGHAYTLCILTDSLWHIFGLQLAETPSIWGTAGGLALGASWPLRIHHCVSFCSHSNSASGASLAWSWCIDANAYSSDTGERGAHCAI